VRCYPLQSCNELTVRHQVVSVEYVLRLPARQFHSGTARNAGSRVAHRGGIRVRVTVNAEIRETMLGELLEIKD
jgi:hypothetical protein